MLNIFLKLILTLTMFTTLPVMGQWEVFDYGVDIGRETENDITLKAALGRANDPFIKYNVTSNAWEFSNNGVKTQPFSTVTQKLKNYPKVKPTLALHFARDKKLDERITFERASKRSCINEFGLIYYLEDDEPCFDHDPETLESKGLLIEESRTNLLTHSNQFDNAVWEKLRSSVIPNAATAPDGSFTALKLIASQENSTHWLRKPNPFITVSVGQVYAESWFVKEAGYNCIAFDPPNGAFGPGSDATINFVTGEKRVGAAGGSIDSKYYGNGWYKVTYISPPAVSAVSTYSFMLMSADATFNGHTFTGDGSSGIYIWGPQFEVGSFPTSTISSTETFTSRASTATYIDQDGLIKTAAIDEERLSYNPENLNVPPKLLLEGASTNLASYSSDFSNSWWSKERITLTTSTIDSPITGKKFKKIVANTENASHGLARTYSFEEGKIYTLSVIAKKGEYDYLYLDFQNIAFGAGSDATFNLATGEVTRGSFKVIAKAEKMIDGSYRCFLTMKAEASSDGNYYIQVKNILGGGAPFAGDGTSGIYVDGVQFEEGYGSSIIETSGSAVTRAEDIYTSTAATRAADLASITGADFSSWYNQNEGTITVSGYEHGRSSSVGRQIFSLNRGSNNNRAELAFDIGLPRVRMFSASEGVTQVNNTFGNISGDRFSASLGFKQDSYAASLNGGTPIEALSGKVPSVDRLYLSAKATGQVVTTTLSKLLYFPKRLTNEELQTTSDPGVNDFLWAVGQ